MSFQSWCEKQGNRKSVDEMKRDAAPELYAALEDMLWPISAGCQKPTIARCKCAKCVEDRARAALAKARGEAVAEAEPEMERARR